MTQTATRRLTARQLAKALAEIDAQIAAVDTVIATYAATFVSDIPEMVYDAWNAAHSARTALVFHRDRVELNPRPIPAGEMGTWELVKANID